MNNKGYGRFRTGGGEWLAHRFSFTLANGDIPDGLLVMHTCDNPGCVNPNHLVLGSHWDNNHDCIDKGRDRKNSPKGELQSFAKMTEAQVIDMRRAYIAGEKLEAIQQRYGLAFRATTQICYGESWRHLLAREGAPSLDDLRKARREKWTALITADDAREIRRRCANGESNVSIARAYNIAATTVSSIKNRKSWKDVE